MVKPRATLASLAVKTVVIIVGILVFVPFVLSMMVGALFAGAALMLGIIHVIPVLAIIFLLYWLFIRQRQTI